MKPTDRYWTVQDIVDVTGATRATVNSWVRRGELIAHRFGRGRRFSEENVQRFMDSRVVKPRMVK